MSESQPALRYGRTAIALHWTVAVCLTAAVTLGLWMASLDRGVTQDNLFAIHKSVGLLILVLMLGRLGWRATHPAPELPPMPAVQRHLARVTHVLLYAIAIAMPISGYVAVTARGRETLFFGMFAVPQWVEPNRALAHTAETVHYISQYVLYALVAAHVGAALYHQFIVRDHLLRRMWR